MLKCCIFWAQDFGPKWDKLELVCCNYLEFDFEDMQTLGLPGPQSFFSRPLCAWRSASPLCAWRSASPLCAWRSASPLCAWRSASPLCAWRSASLARETNYCDHDNPNFQRPRSSTPQKLLIILKRSSYLSITCYHFC